MYFKLAKLFKTLFVRCALHEVTVQSKRIRQSNERVSQAYEAVDRLNEAEAEKRQGLGSRISEATQLMGQG